MWPQLERAYNQRWHYAFGVYSWTYNSAQAAADTLKWHGEGSHYNEYRADGVLGNMSHDYGYLSTQLQQHGLNDHSLVTRSDEPPFLLTSASTRTS